jgi:carboxyl-terminal processing protease
MKRLFYLSVMLVAGLLTGCKKDNKTPVPSSPSKTGTTLQLIQDSIYLYEKEDYLWFDAIPSYAVFNPRSYTGATDQDALTNEINAISQLKINPSTNLPYEYYPADPGVAKYSFVDDGTETASLNGTNGDFGFEPLYNTYTDLRVKYVYPGSPADLAGLKRGYQITSINGNTDLTYDGGSNVNFVINAVYYSQTITMTLLKPDNTSFSVTLTATSYTVNPVLFYNTYNEGNGNIAGYLVFNSFTTLTNAQPQLNTAFNYFITNGVNDVIVDLRYNGGGEVATAEYMDDLIVPAAKTNTLMYTDYFNSSLQANNYKLLGLKYTLSAGDFLPQNNKTTFTKALTLAVNHVLFIVTNATASSAELTINNLRPEMDVQLVGDTTYGKPVAEIPIPINNYVLYSPQFYVENSANQGDYYSGMAPGSTLFPGKLDYDDVTKNFGDTTERLLSDALNFVKTGSYAIKGPQVQSISKAKATFSLYQSRMMALKMEPRKKFKAMVLDKLKARH